MSGGAFPWYDSWWLTRFVRARDYIARHRPARLADFTRALQPLRTNCDFKLQRPERFLSTRQEEVVRSACREIHRDQLELHELASHGRFVVHDHPLLKDLHATLAEDVSRLVGEAVEPSYSFLGLYKQNGRCDVHLDAPVSKWTLDYCIEQSAPWPIAFSDVVPWPEPFEHGQPDWQQRIKASPGLRFTSFAMQPGEAVVFSGSSQWHYREPFVTASPTDFCSLLFLHFVPAGMKEIADCSNWEAAFDAPGLTAAMQ